MYPPSSTDKHGLKYREFIRNFIRKFIRNVIRYFIRNVIRKSVGSGNDTKTTCASLSLRKLLGGTN